MPRNDAAATVHVWPGIPVQAIDIDQPPGIGIAPVANMDAHRPIVMTALAAKSSAETATNARWETRTMSHAQPLYSSWRRHHTSVSLRPLGARSSH
jgi:hypothetical protein